MFEQLLETREGRPTKAAGSAALEELFSPRVPPDDLFACMTAGCFEDAACGCGDEMDTATLTDIGTAALADMGVVSPGDVATGAPEWADGPEWADEEDLRVLVRHLPLDELLLEVPAHRIVGVLRGELPSPRVIEVASALLAMSETTRAQLDWRPWVAAELLTVWQRIESWVASQLDRSIIDVSGPRRSTLDDWEREEAALALRLAPRAAVAVVRRARLRCGPLRRVGAALADGTLLVTQANDLTDAVDPLGDEVADRVLDLVLPVAGDETRGTLDKLTKRAIIEADAEGAAARHEEAKSERGVCLIPLPDGVVDVVLRCTAPEGQSLLVKVDELARLNRRPDQSFDNARADAMLVLMLGGSGTSVATTRGDFRVTITANAFLGLSDDPAMLDGYGAVTAQAARELINADSTLRIAITDAVTGGLLHLSSVGRFATGRLAEHVIARDLTCRMLGCNRPAERCDLDHRVAHKDGGPTCACNIAPLCRRHHRMKDEGGWQLLNQNGFLRWVTPVGRSYEVRPEICDPSVFPLPDPFPLCPSLCVVHPRPRREPMRGRTNSDPPADDGRPTADDHSLLDVPCPF